MMEHRAPTRLDLRRAFSSYLIAYKASSRPGHVDYSLGRIDLLLPAEQMKELARNDDVDLAI